MAASSRVASRWSSPEGDDLYCARWGGDIAKPVALVVFLHGYNASLGAAQDHLAAQLAEHGIACAGIEHWGFARSTYTHSPTSTSRTLRYALCNHGLLGFVPSFERLVRDAIAFAEDCKGAAPQGTPVFLLGESMGGAVALEASRSAPRGVVAGCVLLAPMAGLAKGVVPSPALVALGHVLATLAPTMPAFVMPDLTERTFRNPATPAEVRADPLRLQTRTRLRTAFVLRDAAAGISARLHEYTAPMLVLHGTADVVCPLASSRALCDVAAGQERSDVTLCEYEGAWHALWAEPDDTRARLIADITAWLCARGAGATSDAKGELTPAAAAAAARAGGPLRLARPDGVALYRDGSSPRKAAVVGS